MKKLNKWIDYDFESSSGLTPEFAEFAKDIKSYIKNNNSQEFELKNFSRGHFYFSGFLMNRATGKYVYFSCSDVRHFSNAWNDNLLIRTAEHDKDYTGGRNNNCNLSELFDKVKQLSD